MEVCVVLVVLVAIWHQLIFGLGSFESNAQDSDDWFTVAVGVVNIVDNDVGDSISVSVFVVILVEFDKYRI